MEVNNSSTLDNSNLKLGWVLGYLTKQYLGHLMKQMENSPVKKYYFPLYLIGKNSGKICQQQLADKLLMDKAGLVRILDALTDEGFIERTVNPADRRQHLLHVTKSGAEWIPEIEKALNETDELFYGLIQEKDRANFKKNLDLIVEATKQFTVENVELYYDRTNKKGE